jgi:hypothetical protein
MLLHGSEGGASGWMHCLAAMLAVRGFLAYPHSYSRGGTAWHAGDIVSVPIDETAQALARLKTLPFAGPRAGLYGASRGAELALLLAALTSCDSHPGIPDAVATFATAEKASIARQCHRVEPDLGGGTCTIDMDVWWLAGFPAVEIEAQAVRSKKRRHADMLA